MSKISLLVNFTHYVLNSKQKYGSLFEHFSTIRINVTQIFWTASDILAQTLRITVFGSVVFTTHFLKLVLANCQRSQFLFTSDIDSCFPASKFKT